MLLWIVPLRMLLDLLWWVPVPGGVSAGQLGTGAIALVLLTAVLARWKQAVTHPLRWFLLAAAAVLVLGAVRADDPLDAVTYGLHLGMPVLWLLALWAWPPPEEALPTWVAAGAVPVVAGLVALVAGQPFDHVLHGWPRLLGLYGNVHTHAGVMAVLSVAAAVVGLRGRRWAWAIALGAGVCLVATFVRTAWLWAAIAVAGWALADGRRRLAAGLVALGIVAGVASGRLGDLWAVLTLTPPEGGWAALGSSRGHIWADSLRSFLSGPPADVALGRGLGGQHGLHRHLDPHSDLLSLLYQLGPLGPIVWVGWGIAALRLAWRADALAFGLLLGALVTAPLSNDWLTRSTVVLWVWGVFSLSVGASPARRSA